MVDNKGVKGVIMVISAILHAASAIGKEYHFNVDNHPVHDPTLRHFKQHVHVPLDVPAMR